MQGGGLPKRERLVSFLCRPACANAFIFSQEYGCIHVMGWIFAAPSAVSFQRKQGLVDTSGDRPLLPRTCCFPWCGVVSTRATADRGRGRCCTRRADEPPPGALAPCPETRACQRCCWRQQPLPLPLELPWPPPTHWGLLWLVAAVWRGCRPAAEPPPTVAGGAFGTSPGA